jgi:hypothetical protein
MVDTQHIEYVDNRTLIAEEKAGRAKEYLVGHTNLITDPNVIYSLRRLSFLEIVS